MKHLKPILIVWLLAVFCETSCKKGIGAPPAESKLQLHMDSLAVAVKGTWLYNQFIIKIGPSEEISGEDITNPYNLTLDGKSNLVAQSAIYGASASSNITATYKLTNENGSDFVTFYDSSNNVIGKAYINFPGNNALAIENAQEIDLYFDDGDSMSPILSDPSYQQQYAGSAKCVQYYRQNN